MNNSHPRILSIQSHVVSGYCGNRSATFPLQLHGFEVDVINSVQLSNHTQYKVTKGKIFSKNDFEELYEGLKSNSLTNFYTHILSGYVANVSYIESMSHAIKEIKSNRKNLGLSCLYTLDPVLGDDGPGFYVPGAEKVAEAYKKFLIPLCDIIVPNRFEASHLSGINIDSMNTAMKAIQHFHQAGVSLVVLTSLQLDKSVDELICILSYKVHEDNDNDVNNPNQIYQINIPKLNCPFTGAGDLFASLLTAWLFKTNYDIKKSLEKTVCSVHRILEDTLEWSKKNIDLYSSPFNYELRLVQNKTSIETIDTFIKAYQIK